LTSPWIGIMISQRSLCTFLWGKHPSSCATLSRSLDQVVKGRKEIQSKLARENWNLCHAYPKSLATHPKDGIQGSYNTLEIAQWMKNRFTKCMQSCTKRLHNGWKIIQW
jgi:hypothetical protein